MKEVLFSHISREKLHIVESLSEPVGRLWQVLQKQYTQEGEFYAASPLSSTPLPVYQWIIEHADEFPNWRKVQFVLMDEQVKGSVAPFSYIPKGDPASYERFAKEKFLRPLSSRVEVEVPVLKPDLDKFEEFDNSLEEHGGIDLLVLAIGARGHYAQVMPGTSLETGFHVAKLTPEFVVAHTKAGGPYEGAKFRQYGMSLGPQQVLTARNVVVIISGREKSQLTKELFSYENFNSSFPLSIVHHPGVKEKVSFYITEDVAR